MKAILLSPNETLISLGADPVPVPDPFAGMVNVVTAPQVPALRSSRRHRFALVLQEEFSARPVPARPVPASPLPARRPALVCRR